MAILHILCYILDLGGKLFDFLLNLGLELTGCYHRDE